MSLYRKHRPQKFSEVVGQDHIKTTIGNALKNGSFSHAYIFAGPKGSGKTTTARLLAKALNCTGRDITKDFEPCDKCTSCEEITKGSAIDVVEIDAASNRGIDEIRDLREKIKFAPTNSPYKIYVIDECHMLTKEAFNALLKTLEEPPKHAVFVLATTELHKVPATILSRAQLFDFKKANFEEALSLLKDVAKKEKIEIEDEALALLARLAYGAYRDALTLLDQVAAIQPADGKKITLAEVQAVLGQATEQSVWDLVEALAKKDRNRGLAVIGEVYSDGKDLSYFIGEVINLLRKIVLTQAGLEGQFEASSEEKTKIKELAGLVSPNEVLTMIQKTVEVMPQVKVSVLAQLPLEIVVFELTEDQAKSQKSKAESPKEEKEVIEKIVPKSEPIIQKPVKEEPKPIEVSEKKEEAIVNKPKIEETNTPIADMALTKKWQEVIKIIKVDNNMIAAMLIDAAVRGEDEDKVIVGFKNKFHADQVGSHKIRPMIEAAILQVCGKPLSLDCVVDSNIKIAKPVEPEEALLDAAKDIFASE